MRTILLISSFLFSINAFAGGTGGGGVPPAIYMPNKQFTEIALGILRGEQILVRSEGVDTHFDASNIDPKSGSIIIKSPETGKEFLLQDFDKKFGNTRTLFDSKKLSNKTLGISIPVNPNVTTIPVDGGVGSGGSPPDSEIDGIGGGGGSPPSESELGGAAGGGGPPPESQENESGTSGGTPPSGQ